MSYSNASEAEIQLLEPATHSRRRATAVLMLHDGVIGAVGQRLIGLGRDRSKLVSYTCESHNNPQKLVDQIATTFSNGGSVVIDLQHPPCPTLCRLLAEARGRGTYPTTAYAHQCQSKEIPPASAYLVLLTNSRYREISIRNFCNLFNFIEYV